MRDLTMTLVALHDFTQSLDYVEKHEEIAERARELLEKNARFLLKVQGADGSFHEGYSVPSGAPLGAGDLSTSNWEGIRALLAAYFYTEDEVFLEAARLAQCGK